MLVLSRKPEENFRFPNLGVVVRVLSVKGRAVRIGIEAPDDVQILRGEVAPADGESHHRSKDEASHRWKNQLNEIKLGLVLAERSFQAGKIEDGQEALLHAIHTLSKIESENSLNNSQTGAEVSQENGQRILLVEDDPNELRLLAGILRLEGYEVSTASDGDEAIQQLSSGEINPDFVLLDMRMPRRNGPETIRWIRSQQTLQSLPVFSVSATSPEDMGVTIGPEGVNEWFPKPLDPVKLLRQLHGTQLTVA